MTPLLGNRLDLTAIHGFSSPVSPVEPNVLVQSSIISLEEQTPSGSI